MSSHGEQVLSNPDFVGKVSPDMPCEFHFECVDAAFWMIDSADPAFSAKLAVHGFATEPFRELDPSRVALPSIQ